MGYQFSKPWDLQDQTANQEIKLVSLASVALVTRTKDPETPIPTKDTLNWGISPEEIMDRQAKERFCHNIRNRIMKEGPQSVYPYYIEEELLMCYVEDNKQRFEVIVIPKGLAHIVLKLATMDQQGLT